MTAKDFVKSKFPKARAESYKRQFDGTYWLIWSDFRSNNAIRLAVGKSQSNAWANAKKNILEKEKQ